MSVGQGAIGPASSWQRRLASGSSTDAVKVALVAAVSTSGVAGSRSPSPTAAAVTTGGVMSPLTQLYSAGVRSREPSGRTARTRSSCSPYGRPVTSYGEAQRRERVRRRRASTRRSSPRASVETVKVASELSTLGGGPGEDRRSRARPQDEGVHGRRRVGVADVVDGADRDVCAPSGEALERQVVPAVASQPSHGPPSSGTRTRARRTRCASSRAGELEAQAVGLDEVEPVRGARPPRSSCRAA